MPDVLLSPLPQLDGLDGIHPDQGQHYVALPGNGMILPGPSMETNAQFTGHVFTAPQPTPVASFQQPPVRAKVTNYTLDRAKQLKKLRRDTSLSEFSIEVSKK